MMGREVSGRSYPEIGVPDSHHPLSHHMRDPARLEKLARVNAFHMQQFSYFIQKLSAIQEGDGTVLDHSLILYGAGLADSNDHSHDDLPILVVGGGFQGNRHLRFPRETPMNNLLLTMLIKAGIEAESLGDSTGQLKQLSEI
jgi:hypothetical protein